MKERENSRGKRQEKKSPMSKVGVSENCSGKFSVKTEKNQSLPGIEPGTFVGVQQTQFPHIS